MTIETTAGAIDPGGLEPSPSVNTPPIVTGVPNPVFIQGAASQYDLDQFMSDADGDMITARLNTDILPLPQGVTLQALPNNNALVYDGVGAQAFITFGHS